MHKLTRREFIKGSIVASGMLFFSEPYKLISSQKQEDWIMPEQGRISYISGRVTVNEKPAEIGQLVGIGDTIASHEKSEADIELRDYSIFHIKENTIVVLEQLIENNKIKVKKGWFLNIVKKGTPFSVETPMVLAGVRGTVFFFYVPSNTNHYMCDCNGVVVLSNAFSNKQLVRVASTYHKAYSISKENDEVKLTPAGLKYHGDNDILRIAERFPRETRIFKEKRGSSY